MELEFRGWLGGLFVVVLIALAAFLTYNGNMMVKHARSRFAIANGWWAVTPAGRQYRRRCIWGLVAFGLWAGAALLLLGVG